MNHEPAARPQPEVHPLPTGVDLERFLECLAGWDAAGAADGPRRADEVEQVTGNFDAVQAQVPFLQAMGVLVHEETGQRLTERGSDLARALATGDVDRARDQARGLLGGVPLTETVSGIVRGNPVRESELVPLVVTASRRSTGDDRAHADALTLVNLFEWAGVLTRDESGRYRIPDASDPARSEQSGYRDADERHALSLDLSVDSLQVDVTADPDGLEEVVSGLRRGLLPDGD